MLFSKFGSKNISLYVAVLIALVIPLQLLAQSELRILETRKIYDNNSYCAFTGLIEFKGKYYCTFREASRHHIQFDDTSTWGKIVLLESDNALEWNKIAVFEQDSIDMRDPKIKITPDGKHLMLLYHKHRILKDKICNPYSVVRIIDEYSGFESKEERIVVYGYEKTPVVLWNVTYFKKHLYGFICGPKFMLVRTKDGINYEVVSDCTTWAKDNGGMNESNIVFIGNKAVAVIRSSDNQGYLGEAKYPYKKWKWQKMNISVGGPNLLLLNRRTILLGSRDYGQDENRGKTTIYILNRNKWTEAERFQVLESTYDSSYPCLLLLKDKMLVSYYSGDGRHSNIYLALLEIK